VSGLIERRVLEVNPAPTSGLDIPASRASGWRVAEVWAVLSRIGTKDEIGKKAAIA
jgi:hypothetical protein